MSVVIPDNLADRLLRAERVAVLTGVGLSVEVGLPTPSAARVGQWANHDMMELATPQAFARHPRRVWSWYAYRRRLAEATAPGSSHYALVDMEQHFADFTLITQSVDGLHWRAGSRELLELHGNLCRIRCYECGAYAEVAPSPHNDEYGPPICEPCGGWLRPDVVWYGEGLPSHLVRRAQRAAEHAQVFLVAGAQAMVQPAAQLPLLARRAGAYLVEISPDETALSVLVDERLPLAPAKALPALAGLVMGVRSREEGA